MKIPSASASQPPRPTDTDVVIDIAPPQQHTAAPTPAANPALSRLAPRPSGRRSNPERGTGSGSAADISQHGGESPLLHADNSTSERFFDAVDFLSASGPVVH
ncbi:hypothetical protein [Xanthomonas arboricola]|uniref:hypothetical protein n=1 Tax=Xanthomonas arboricola TaxID=56448 RepID=UPI0015E44583|nr:hypothetical protein [Xanthomonas arboricola]